MKTKNKRCPRCNFKVEEYAGVCPKCRLNYEKFNSATNKEGIKTLAEGDKERVIYRNGCPTDVKKWKLLLFTIFLGFCGGHYFYVGRKNWGIFYFVFFLVGVVNAIIQLCLGRTPDGELYQVFYLLVLIWGVVLVLWLIDIIKVIFNRFKIPVSLPR